MRDRSRTPALEAGRPPPRLLPLRPFPPGGTPGVTTCRSRGASPHASVAPGMAPLCGSFAADAPRMGEMLRPLDVTSRAGCRPVRPGHPLAEYVGHSSPSQSRICHGDGALGSRRGRLRRNDGRRRRPLAAHPRASWSFSPRYQADVGCGPGRRGSGRADADGFFRSHPCPRSVEVRPLRRSCHGDTPMAEITAHLAHTAWESLFVVPIPEPHGVVSAPAETERISSQYPRKERKP